MPKIKFGEKALLEKVWFIRVLNIPVIRTRLLEKLEAIFVWDPFLLLL